MIRLSPSYLALAALGLGGPLRAEVPLSIAESGHATVPVEIEGIGVFEFVLDTGAEESALYSPFEAVHHLPLSAEATELQGQTGSAPVRLAALPPLIVDGLRAEDVAAVVLEPRADGVPLSESSASTCSGEPRSISTSRASALSSSRAARPCRASTRATPSPQPRQRADC
ncbi:MAG TPA: retropepsin-like aspartic protease [Gammaproteobacteria bacterium]